MTSSSLIAIERISLVLGLVLTLFGLRAWGARGGVAVALGSLISFVNLRAIRWLSLRAVEETERARPGAAARLAVGLLLKMGLLFFVVWLAIRLGDLPLLPFGVGLSVLVFSLLVWAVWSGYFPTGEGVF